jgi:hypothetical protein
VGYVFYGEEEKQLGDPEWLSAFEVIFQVGDYAIYEAVYP